MSNAAPELPLTLGHLQAMARSAAMGAGVDPNLFIHLIQEESGWNPDAESPAGAVGLGQLTPATARSMGVVNIKDPIQNLRGSARYLAQQLRTFGNPSLALAAYNAGPAAVKKFGGIPPYAETQAYVSNILGRAAKANSSQPTPQPGEPYVPPPEAGGGGDVAIPDLPNIGAFPPVKDPFPPVGGVHGAPPGESPNAGNGWGGVYPPGTISNFQAFNQLSNDKTYNDILKMGGVPGSVLSTIRLPTPAERVSVANQQRNFTFKFGDPSAPIAPQAARAIASAKEYLGTPYVWGGESSKGFDCSGLLQFTWAKAGVPIPRTTYDQWQVGQKITGPRALQPGDAVFFKGSDSKTSPSGDVLPGHVAMYIGNGMVIQAPHTGATVEITKLSSIPGFMGARRYSNQKGAM